jgi:hypothetical protein
MKNFRLTLFRLFIPGLIIIFLSRTSPVRSEEEESLFRLESWLDRDKAHIGDPVTYYLRVTAPAAAEVEFLPPEMEPDELEIRESGEGERESEAGKVRERRFVLKSFQTGSHSLPPATVRLRFPAGGEETLKSAPLVLKIESLLDPSHPPSDIRDIKPPLELEVSYRGLIFLLIGGLALAALAVFLARKVFRRKEKVVPLPPPLPAHEIAYRELARIRKADLPSRGRIKEYYFRISDVLRHYLENRFRLRAPERTTEEFLIDMATTNVLSLGHQDLVGSFLSHCDLVKFARYGPTAPEIEGVYDSAVRLVDETKFFPEEKI